VSSTGSVRIACEFGGPVGAVAAVAGATTGSAYESRTTPKRTVPNQRGQYAGVSGDWTAVTRRGSALRTRGVGQRRSPPGEPTRGGRSV